MLQVFDLVHALPAIIKGERLKATAGIRPPGGPSRHIGPTFAKP